MLKLDSVFLNSENPKALAQFWQKVIGVKPQWSDGDFVGFRLGSGGILIGPHEKIKGKNLNPERVMFNLETDDVELEYKRLVELGAKSIAKPYHPMEAEDMLIATLADPDDNYFQLASPM